jgi:hypothetical protein
MAIRQPHFDRMNPRPMMKMLRRGVPLILMATLVGCGDGRVKLPTARVTGTVSYRGKPLSFGTIVFCHPSGQAAGASLAANGTFELAAFQGQNQVAVECYKGQENGKFKGRPGGAIWREPGSSLIPERYGELTTSGLAFEVKPGENDKAEFLLKD